MPTERDCINHVIHRVDKDLAKGAKVHIVWFDIFDPAMMIDCTPLSDDMNVHVSEALDRNVFVRLTRHEESGNGTFFVTLNGGTREIKAEIVTRFLEQLHLPKANYQDLSIKDSVTFEWVVPKA